VVIVGFVVIVVNVIVNVIVSVVVVVGHCAAATSAVLLPPLPPPLPLLPLPPPSCHQAAAALPLPLLLQLLPRCHNASIKECTRNHREEFIKMCQTAATKILGKNAFKNEEEAMKNIMTLPNSKLYRDSIEQYFTINKDMKYLGEKGKSFKCPIPFRKIEACCCC
jgi:hypothetical protein